MTIVAFEGASYGGKSSTIKRLRGMRGIGPHAFVSACYVDHIDRREDIPPARTGSAAEQVAAFDKFMQIEAARVTAVTESTADLIILDRSVDTLLAHAYALDKLYGYNVQARLRACLATLPHLKPDHTIYLDVPPETLHLRRKIIGHAAAESDYFLHNPAFLDHARAYFTTPTSGAEPVSREVTLLPADTTPTDVAEAARALILHWTK
ncbi:hypothetical protein OG321_41835 [Streptomyces sp. NBC_00424]|uniref:hypothetical protein n=1 Tax=Streptomyces sp. NBC_00424 TaxID=2903648 RepID=UPI002254842F|nr:hypothetical protein [Streptomyces sp. NBC_00424]MCX5078945.1 hypothetical protein [Streptomyces sp. NBC_00424]